jgi:hypothetical protein
MSAALDRAVDRTRGVSDDGLLGLEDLLDNAHWDGHTAMARTTPCGFGGLAWSTCLRDDLIGAHCLAASDGSDEDVARYGAPASAGALAWTWRGDAALVEAYASAFSERLRGHGFTSHSDVRAD